MVKKVKNFKGEYVVDDMELKIPTCNAFEMFHILNTKRYTDIYNNGGIYYGIYKNTYDDKTGKKKGEYLQHAHLTFESALADFKEYNYDLSKYIKQGYDITKLEHIIHITKDFEYFINICKLNMGTVPTLMNYLAMCPKLEEISSMISIIFKKRHISIHSIYTMIEAELPFNKMFIKFIATRGNIDMSDERIKNMMRLKKIDKSDIADEIEMRYYIGGQQLVDEWLNPYIDLEGNKSKKKTKKGAK